MSDLSPDEKRIAAGAREFMQKMEGRTYYVYTELDYAVSLLRAAYPYLESMIGVASGMRSLLPDVKEFLQHHPCDYDPRQMAGAPLGMYHCPKCGEMVIAGVEHPKEFNDAGA